MVIFNNNKKKLIVSFFLKQQNSFQLEERINAEKKTRTYILRVKNQSEVRTAAQGHFRHSNKKV